MLPRTLKLNGEYKIVSPSVQSKVAEVNYTIEVELTHDKWSGPSNRSLSFPIRVYEANRQTWPGVTYVPLDATQRLREEAQREVQRRLANQIVAGVPYNAEEEGGAA